MRCARNQRNAFTLVEIMIVVAIIGLLAALAIPSFVKARKQSQGRRIVNDARQIDGAMDQVAMNQGLADGIYENQSDIVSYLKSSPTSSGLGFFSGGSGGGALGPIILGSVWVDLLGNPYVLGPVGTNQVTISPVTKSALHGVGIDWGTY